MTSVQKQVNKVMEEVLCEPTVSLSPVGEIPDEEACTRRNRDPLTTALGTDATLRALVASNLTKLPLNT